MGEDAEDQTERQKSPVAKKRGLSMDQGDEVPDQSGYVPSQQEAFADYKRSEGREHENNFSANKEGLKLKKGRFKRLSVQINDVKRDIDDFNKRINRKRLERNGNRQQSDGVEVIDEEEFALIRDCKAQKLAYKTLFAERRQCQSEVNYLKGLVQQSKLTLCNHFLEYYKQKYPDTGTLDFDQEKSPNGDILDDGEKFEQLQQRKLMEEDPEAVPFYNAAKGKHLDPKNRKDKMRVGRHFKY